MTRESDLVLWGGDPMTSILQCPVCRSILLSSPDGYQCPHYHTFDAAREGYVNLLLSHQKHSKKPGDSPEMILSRRRFLDLGLYDRISDGINEAVGVTLTGINHESPFSILDAGCGEGFYLTRFKNAAMRSIANQTSIDYFGIDISKFAVRQATKRDKMIDWFVASISDLPFLPASLDVVLNVFSPANIAEFARVLRSHGGLVVVSPGPSHLNGLREIIYPEAREHAPSALLELTRDLFSLSHEARINYAVELPDNGVIMDLLAMTPYFWNIDVKTKSKVEALDRLELDVDVMVRVFTKTAG